MHLIGRCPGFNGQHPPYARFFPLLLALTISARTTRADAQADKPPRTLNPVSSDSIDRKQPEFNNFKQPCNFYCYLSTEKQDEVKCTAIPFAPPQNQPTNIPCYLDTEDRQIVIGNKSSVRRIAPGGLRVLANPRALQPPFNKNHLNLYLRLNILEMNATALEGLEGALQQIQIYNLHDLHPDTFFHHRRLSAFALDTATAPEFPRSLAAKLQQDATGLPIRPFFRLFPEDVGNPFALNMDVRCHRCGNDSESVGSEEMEDPIIITFPQERKPSTPVPALNVLDALSLMYLDSCPRLEDGLGCPLRLDAENDNTSNTTTLGNPLLPYVVSELAPTGWSDNDGLTDDLATDDDSDALVVATAGHNSALTTFLVVWCSLITVILLCVCVVLFI
ncbi:unnamed protein product, partial [Dibothriocephalus latus]